MQSEPDGSIAANGKGQPVSRQLNVVLDVEIGNQQTAISQFTSFPSIWAVERLNADG
jgi:hypothetical protein